MIIQCQGCAAKYFLPEERVPENPTKVRCPKCKAVFTLVPNAEPVAAGRAARSPMDVGPEAVAVPPMEKAPEAPVAAEPAAEPAAPVEDRPQTQKRRGGRGKEDRAKRLARVLVSDILIYNREKRDESLAEGTLMAALGDEIKKSWELYKEKVGPDVANSNNYFKEALNEILADGQEVF
jgi:predicted Zn finger-like uncharacterized protein